MHRAILHGVASYDLCRRRCGRKYIASVRLRHLNWHFLGFPNFWGSLFLTDFVKERLKSVCMYFWGKKKVSKARLLKKCYLKTCLKKYLIWLWWWCCYEEGNRGHMTFYSGSLVKEFIKRISGQKACVPYKVISIYIHIVK